MQYNTAICNTSLFQNIYKTSTQSVGLSPSSSFYPLLTQQAESNLVIQEFPLPIHVLFLENFRGILICRSTVEHFEIKKFGHGSSECEYI